VLPRPAAEEPVSTEASPAAPDLIETEPTPAPFGIHLLDPSLPPKKRKKNALWPTAIETNVQLSLFD
jgi:hypothetical protein